MAPTNRLPEFRALLPPSGSGGSTTPYPPISRPGTPSQPGQGQGQQAGIGSFARRRRRKRLTEEEVREKEEEKEFLREGYSIYTHLTSLSMHLQTIRLAYLSTQPVPISRASTPRPPGGSTSTPEDPEQRRLKALERAKVLTEREREEVDLRARVVLGGCKERVGVLEVREKIRQNRTKPSATGSLLSTLLPSLTNSNEQTGITPQQRSTILTAHHASILWSLNNSLLKLSDTIREMQEERAKIRSERGKSLGGLVSEPDGSGGAGGLIRRLGAGKRVGVNGKPVVLTIPTMPLSEGSMKDQGLDQTLTQEQIQQFSSENDTLLESMNSTLNTVLRAEKSLLEISQLQSSLIAHLATQTESIELLYDEAIETVADLDRANTQLKRARERGKEGRLYLVVFLVIASLALLFLDFYS